MTAWDGMMITIYEAYSVVGGPETVLDSDASIARVFSRITSAFFFGCLKERYPPLVTRISCTKCARARCLIVSSSRSRSHGPERSYPPWQTPIQKECRIRRRGTLFERGKTCLVLDFNTCYCISPGNYDRPGSLFVI